MPTSSLDNSTPLYIFEVPLHGIIMVGFGLVGWTIAASIYAVGKNSKFVQNANRHNPWYVLIYKRPLTKEEGERFLSDDFFKVYKAFGFIGMWIFGSIGALGLIGTFVACLKLIIN